ncbi:MAG: hypothetical protein WCV70_02080 [Patescibacteria group bacterium]|jgi:hypothetical protein
MFNFFRKNKSGQTEAIKEEIQGPALKEPVKADNIAIHVMPERFRNQPVKKDSAKTTGLVIIIGGAVVLLIASAGLYYFLFRKPSVVITQEPSLTAENNQPTEASQAGEKTEKKPEASSALTATGTEITTLPLGGETATTTIATTTPEIASGEEGLSLRVGADGDNDGLTDMEEILLNASAIVPDTDGDGYTDGSELINLYNPAGAGKLTANSNISLYENKTFSYDLLYPTTWQTSVNGGDDSLMFKTGDNQFVQVIVQPNVDKQALDAWYMEQLGVLTINETDRVSGSNLPTGQAGWQGIKSPDGLNIYLIDKKQNYIFSLTYNPGGGNILEYFNIFQMMVKSFNLKD